MTNDVGQKLWNVCHLLRESGVSSGDYLEQLTYLLFLKIMDEKAQSSSGYAVCLPGHLRWETLLRQEGAALLAQYQHMLRELGAQTGMLGIIFRGAVCRIQNASSLRRLIVNIDQEAWLFWGGDVLADAYEGLLQKTAADMRSGTGQYFTPRPLVQAIVEVMCPEPGQRICDPACGAGGFLLAAYEYIARHYEMTGEERTFLKNQALEGWEIVDATARLCMMNLFLHGIGDENAKEGLIHVQDSVICKPGALFDIVLANPPFGRKSDLSQDPATGTKNARADAREVAIDRRDDFWAKTSNKQLNFVQHIYSLLKPNGRAAVVVPDNVLFEGGVGEIIRRNLLQFCDVHTLLRLPTGIFYAPGVKANVLFMDKRPAGSHAQTERLWVYDLRTNVHCTLRTRPFVRAHLEDFIACYHPENRHTRSASERFRPFDYEDLCRRDKLNLDLCWLQDASLDDTDALLSPAEIASAIVVDLQQALEQFRNLTAD